MDLPGCPRSSRSYAGVKPVDLPGLRSPSRLPHAASPLLIEAFQHRKLSNIGSFEEESSSSDVEAAVPSLSSSAHISPASPSKPTAST